MASPFINGAYATNYGIHTEKTRANYTERGAWNVKVRIGFSPKMNPSTASNLLRIAGWIPGIGIITGAYRLYAIFKSNDNVDVENGCHQWTQVGRAVAEILCLGPLLMIADIAFTAMRSTSVLGCFPNPYSEESLLKGLQESKIYFPSTL